MKILFFQSGDLSTATVFSTCPCDSSLNWAIVRGGAVRDNKRKQLITWGKEIGHIYHHRLHEKQDSILNSESVRENGTDYGDLCAYRIRYVK